MTGRERRGEGSLGRCLCTDLSGDWYLRRTLPWHWYENVGKYLFCKNQQLNLFWHMAQHGTHIAINISELGPGLYCYHGSQSLIRIIKCLFSIQSRESTGGGEGSVPVLTLDSNCWWQAIFYSLLDIVRTCYWTHRKLIIKLWENWHHRISLALASTNRNYIKTLYKLEQREPTKIEMSSIY